MASIVGMYNAPPLLSCISFSVLRLFDVRDGKVCSRDCPQAEMYDYTIWYGASRCTRSWDAHGESRAWCEIHAFKEMTHEFINAYLLFSILPGISGMGIGASSPKRNFKAASERKLDESLVIRLLDESDYSKGMSRSINDINMPFCS